MTPEERLDELWKKIDAFTSRVASRYPGALACASGCSDCCHREITVTSIEAERVAALVLELPASERATLAANSASSDPCVALLPDGACSIYAARPVVCRSHGLPLRFVEPTKQGKTSLPILDVCPKNFVDRDLSAIDPACVLDQQTLSVLLGAIDALHARETGAAEGSRYALRDVLAAACEEPQTEASAS